MGGKYLSYVRMKSPQQALEVEVWKEIFSFVHVFEEKFQSFCKNFGLSEFEGIEDFEGRWGDGEETMKPSLQSVIRKGRNGLKVGFLSKEDD